MKRKMEIWDSHQASRTKLIEERISLGYEKSRRTRLREGSSAQGSQSHVHEEREQNTPNAKSSSDKNPPHGPKKLSVKRRRIPSPCPLDVKDDLKETCFQSHLDDTSQRGDSRVDIEIQHKKFDCKSPILLSPEIFHESLKKGVTFHLKSPRFNLAVDFHASMEDDVIDFEASTNTMNTFAFLWWSFLSKKKSKDSVLKNFFGMPDLGQKVFTFFPLLDSAHWTLLVLYNPRHRQLLKLPKKRSAILYFDSLGMRSLKRYKNVLHRIFAHYATFCRDPDMKMELLEPNKMIGFQSIETPQQPNEYDCGYYVKTCMHFLIQGGLKNDRSKTWLKTNWFTHEDVEYLKSMLLDWTHSIVGQVSIGPSSS